MWQDINFFWIIISYLIGSIPFGYIITRLSTGKNILEIGWRKTSGSNVFRNIGVWQGVLTGVLDLIKGFIAVELAQNLGFSPLIQVLSGVAAVMGHNWSCFLRFAGGRGIATFIGAGLSLIPRTLGLSLIFPIILALVWDSSIATILFLATVIFLSFRFNQFKTGTIFGLLSLMPIFIKRLSPIKEIKGAQNKTLLARNRLIFDDDIFHSEPRIKKIIRRLSR